MNQKYLKLWKKYDVSSLSKENLCIQCEYLLILFYLVQKDRVVNVVCTGKHP
jgi:hypothetical protein